MLREPPHAIAHDVWVASGSLLETLMRERLEGDTCAVNSRHHQAPDQRWAKDSSPAPPRLTA